MDKLFLLDAYALIYRAYYALIRAPRITSKGFNTSAIFGFCNTLDEILRKENPSHIAVCFDPPGPTFRHDMYDQYKAQREAQPEDISASVPIIKEIVEAYRIPVFEIPGYEADDVIGTLSRMAARKGFTTYMMTPDKDYGQLVDEHTFMYRPSLRGLDFEIRGVKEVCERYGISSPLQVIDLLALEGDKIDNIPGCPGVGEKTAVKLIGEFGSIENMIARAAEIPGAIGRKVRENADQITFSKKLATIRTDVPVEVDFDTLRRGPVDTEALRAIFTRLEFKTFLSRLNRGESTAEKVASADAAVKGSTADKRSTSGKGGAKATADAGKSAQPSLFDFLDAPDEAPAADSAPRTLETVTTVVSGEEAIGHFVEEVAAAPFAAIALYAIGEEAMTAQLRAIAVSTAEGNATYIDIPARPDDKARLMALLEPLFTSPQTTLVSHDIKRDMVLLRRERILLSAPYFDTRLAHYLLQPEMRHRLSDIALNVLGLTADDYADADAARKPYGPLPAGKEVLRLGQAADLTGRLRLPLLTLLRQNSQEQLLDDIELPLAAVLADMEWNGVRIDVAELKSLSETLSARLRGVEEEVYDLAGEKFNIGSPSQVGEILFGKLALDPKAKRTKTGAYSTTEEILLKHRAGNPIVEKILEARSLRKLLATYVDALPALINPLTGKIHSTFNQTVTATGRISSANPNLQNIPIRTDLGREVRRAFVADPGCVLLSADYSQIELRLLACMSDDPELTEAFNSGLDIHRATAAKIYHIPYDEVDDNQRRKAKTANFGTVYGISAFGLSERLGIPRAEARDLIDGYFATYPHIRRYIDDSIARAREQGYVTTIMGRKRYLPDINSRNATVRSFAERNAVNAPLQGSAADIIKKAMIRVAHRLNADSYRSKLILQVHDELILNVPADELPRVQQMVVAEMEDSFHGCVPLEVSSGAASNWLEAH